MNTADGVTCQTEEAFEGEAFFAGAWRPVGRHTPKLHENISNKTKVLATTFFVRKYALWIFYRLVAARNVRIKLTFNS